MIESLKKLDTADFRKLKDSVALITILVAGADGKIDFKEKNWGKKITEVRSYSSEAVLNSFYKEVGLDFSERFQHFIDVLPVGLDSRNKDIADKLAELNDILPQLGSDNASMLYKDFLSFAKHVAKISGGFLGFLSISKSEEKMMKLSMINDFS